MAEKGKLSSGVRWRTWRVFALLVVLCTATLAQQTISTPTSDNHNESLVCPENQYFDHGTSSCEHCSDICKDAEYKKTVEDCQRQCPAIYRAMQDKQQKPEIGISGASTNPKPPLDSSTNLEFAVGASIVGVVVIAAVIGIVVVTRKLRQKKATSPRYSPAVQEEEGEQAARERLSHTDRLRRWLSRGVFGAHGPVPAVHAVESVAGREGPQEIVVLGSSQSSQGSALGTSNSHHLHNMTSLAKVHSNGPIYKPSAGLLAAATDAQQPRNPIYKPSAAASRKLSSQCSPVAGRSPPKHMGPVTLI